MKLSRFAPVLLILAISVARAQDDDKDHPQQAPEEIPDFSNLDDYIYVPKTTVSLGTRFLSGAKTAFSGMGTLPSPVNPGSDPTVSNVSRTYVDGIVQPDGRATQIDNGNGTVTTVAIASDGKTNTWNYTNSAQLTTDGYMQFHTYSAEITNANTFSHNGNGSLGIELQAVREMGMIGKHIQWSILGGMSISDIHSVYLTPVSANVTTTTDTYDLYGQIPPAAPYSSPGGGTSQNVLDSSGNVINNSSGTPVTQTVDNTVLLSNTPLNRTVSTAASTAVDNRFHVSGAYYTFRAGPAFMIPFGAHFKLTLSAGLAIVYAGSQYSVEEILTPEFGDTVDDIYTKDNSHLLPGYFADLTLQYNITDTAGLYMGAVYQSAGSYKQEVSSGTGSSDVYTTKIDLSNQQGLRAGMTVKF